MIFLCVQSMLLCHALKHEDSDVKLISLFQLLKE